MKAPCSPCRGCEEREVGCHAHCLKYKDFQAENDAYNTKVRANKDADLNVMRFQVDQDRRVRLATQSRYKTRKTHKIVEVKE